MQFCKQLWRERGKTDGRWGHAQTLTLCEKRCWMSTEHSYSPRRLRVVRTKYTMCSRYCTQVFFIFSNTNKLLMSCLLGFSFMNYLRLWCYDYINTFCSTYIYIYSMCVNSGERDLCGEFQWGSVSSPPWGSGSTSREEIRHWSGAREITEHPRAGNVSDKINLTRSSRQM